MTKQEIEATENLVLEECFGVALRDFIRYFKFEDVNFEDMKVVFKVKDVYKEWHKNPKGRKPHVEKIVYPLHEDSKGNYCFEFSSDHFYTFIKKVSKEAKALIEENKRMFGKDDIRRMFEKD